MTQKGRCGNSSTSLTGRRLLVAWHMSVWNKSKTSDTTASHCSQTELIVRKPPPLIALTQSDLTLADLQILDICLAKLDSASNSSLSAVIFDKTELEQLLGVQDLKLAAIEKTFMYLDSAILVGDRTSPGSFRCVYLFEAAEAGVNAAGDWQLTVWTTPSANQHVFRFDDPNCLSYRLEDVINLRSRHSYSLFMHLTQNRALRRWKAPVGALCKQLHCDETYQDFRRLSAEILEPAQTELQTVSGLKFSYSPVVGKGRNVTHVLFSMAP